MAEVNIEEIPLEAEAQPLTTEENTIETNAPVAPPLKRGRGRPPGSKNKKTKTPVAAEPEEPEPEPEPQPTAKAKAKAKPKTKAKAKARQAAYAADSETESSDEEEAYIAQRARGRSARNAAAPVHPAAMAAEVLGLLQQQHVARASQRRNHYAQWFNNM